MSKSFLMVLVLLAFVPQCFAGVFLSPESLELSLVGGETVSETISVSGDFLVPVGVVLEAVVFSESGDANGFVVSFDKNVFVLLPGVPVDIVVSFFAVSNILPEKYSIELNAIASVDVPVPATPVPVVVNRGSSGGGGWMAPTRHVVDENVIEDVVDENVVVVVPIQPRPSAPCVERGQPFWHRDCCEGLIKRPTTLTCEHPDVVLSGTPPESIPTGFLFLGLELNYWLLLLIILLTTAIILHFLYYRHNKKKEEKKIMEEFIHE